MNTVRLDLFDARRGFERGRPVWIVGLWQLAKAIFFMNDLPWPSRLRAAILRLFGAKIGRGLYIRPRVNIHFPWKLEIGDHCWIGDDCGIHNMEPVRFGSHVALAHRVYVTSGNHDFTDPTMSYRNRPVVIDDGVWVASCAFVGPGVVLGQHCVIGAGAVVTKSVEPWAIMRGNPAARVGTRVLQS